MEYPYLEGPWVYKGFKPATIESILEAIRETLEYGFTGSFWVVINENDSLSVYEDLKIRYELNDNFGENAYINQEIQLKVQNWETVREIFELILDPKVVGVGKILRNSGRKEKNYISTWLAKIQPYKKDGQGVEEYTLEAEGMLSVDFRYSNEVEEEKIKVIMESWEEVEKLYALFLDSKFDNVRNILRNKIDCKR
ncbi:hypothetical protein [Chitinophaga niabensis]|uniref:Uncharacterized protein n=1 Tax=Chitinophaga niabensis TaxID=536979 RepID=A0A1N6KBB7_9BACT|nr:hypothetical protein [Chitinophaga niabensis]SIO53743.1 hypothetical protein SAMN04488055_5471 [Chitinophaga niabensis]